MPSIQKRVSVLRKLQEKGWKIAIRFEPLIFENTLLDNYKDLFDQLFQSLDVNQLHSVSLGEFRMPKTYFKSIVKLYPEEELFARETTIENGLISLKDTDSESLQHIENLLKTYVSREKYYFCG